MNQILKAICVSLIFIFPLIANAQEKQCAVILMHGKWATNQSLYFFGNRLKPFCEPRAIEMPWSQRRNYDEPYEVALADIKSQVEKFRQQGYKRVVLAGHSFGANAALAYMKMEGDVDAIVLLAPGHTPFVMYQRGIGKDAVDKARELVALQRGEEILSMDDYNQGLHRTIRMKANVLLSYFDPNGLGNMPLSAGSFKRSVPVFWVVGTQDPLYLLGSSYGYDKTPQNSSSKYLVVEADHGRTPDAAVSQVSEWLKSLP
jgi:pimeloyl-ACP methyl ester carboxylesterase